jgi:hypothetical protein
MNLFERIHFYLRGYKCDINPRGDVHYMKMII